MGCGASKDDIAEPRRMQSHGRDILQRVDTQAIRETVVVKPIDLTSDCICSLYNSSGMLNDPSSPPSAFIHTSGSLSTSDDDDEDDEDFDPNSFDIPSKLSIVEEGDTNECGTTALAALSGEKTVTEKVEVEERVEVIKAADNEKSIVEQSDECCALGMLTSQSAILQALLSTGPVITKQNLGADFPTRIGHVAVISGPEPIRWEPTLRKAEIIDLDVSCSCVLRPSLRIISQDQEPDAGESVLMENTPEPQQEKQSDQQQEEQFDQQEEQQFDQQQEEQFDQEPADDHALTEEQPKQDLKPDDAIENIKPLTYSGPEPRIKSKLPPLTIVPPILVELPANPFAKPALPIIVKKDLLEVKVPFICETEQFEDLSADRTPHLALCQDSLNGDNHDVRSKSSLVTEHDDGTPTPATKSPADSEWRSLHRDTPDPDIENIDLLESPEQDSLPLLPMLDCHGIHTDKKDLISPSLRIVA
ncbi:hypothetical protein KC19_4G185600 [Ceratodon purpureus]|uniref:Uncharacterized protein n=1 Tax=Ceratodon purpureus TaxID=3225 RepID=A0A8T0ICC5_CERPU|nr:hypothetical protein KC19_4G185600 [Ceratodon purpureus]